jgi:hypothetical protein
MRSLDINLRESVTALIDNRVNFNVVHKKGLFMFDGERAEVNTIGKEGHHSDLNHNTESVNRGFI